MTDATANDRLFKSRERKVRRLARRLGYRIRKSRQRPTAAAAISRYSVINVYWQAEVCGGRTDGVTLTEVEEFLGLPSRRAEAAISP